MAEEKNDTPNEQAETRKKLRFKKTETSRLKKTGGGEEQAKAEEAPAPPRGEAGETAERISDPMSLRDTHTSKVRRVQAGKDTGPAATAVPPGTVDESKKTETVHLKVVQQKKKEIADMMSPSSTVRLRAPSGKKGAAAAPRKGTDKDTIKVPPPRAAEAEKPEGAEGQPAAAAAAPSSTVKAQPPAEKKTSTQSIEKVKPKPAAEADQTTAVPRPEAAEGEGGAKDAPSKQTLKLRGSGKPGKTLKVPAGKEGGGGTVKLKRGKGGAQTQEVPAPAGVPGAAAAPRAVADAEAGQPGILFTLAAVVSTVAMGAAVYFLVTQLMAHIL